MSAHDIIRMVLSLVFVALTLGRAWTLAIEDQTDAVRAWAAIVLSAAGIALIILEAQH